MRLPSPAPRYDVRDQAETRRALEAEILRLIALTTGAVVADKSGLVAIAGLLRASGNIAYGIRRITASDTLLQDDGVLEVDSTAGAVTVTLPAATGAVGRTHVLVHVAGANAVTLARSGADTVMSAAGTGATTYAMGAAGTGVRCVGLSTGDTWFVGAFA